MEKVIAITVHTERLHSDFLWKKIEKILEFFKKYNIKTTWFSVNPTFVGYRTMGFEEGKWIKRLNILKDFKQEIQQHTHFYKGKEGVKKGLGYDLGRENIKLRLLEDREWLKEKIGVVPEGFISGAWKDNEEIIKALREEGYKYNLTSKVLKVESSEGFLEIPNSNFKSLIKDFFSFRLNEKFINHNRFSFCTLYFHDYDLERFSFNIFLRVLILGLVFLNFKFVPLKELYERLKSNQN